MSVEYKKTCKYLKYVESLFILSLAITVCVSISAFASLVCVPVAIMSSAIGTKICVIFAGINSCEPVIKNKKKKHDKMLLLGKDKLNIIEVLIFKVLIDLYISHDEFVRVKNVLREYYKMKKEIKNPETSVE